jgi:hypothetical protein
MNTTPPAAPIAIVVPARPNYVAVVRAAIASLATIPAAPTHGRFATRHRRRRGRRSGRCWQSCCAG